MFLIRSAFWLTLLVALIPSDPAEQARMYKTASSALHWAATFCDRNTAVCKEAQSHWVVLKDKAGVGAQMLAELVNERLHGRGAAQPTALPILEQPLPAADTLRPADRAPEWRMKVRAQL